MQPIKTTWENDSTQKIDSVRDSKNRLDSTQTTRLPTLIRSPDLDFRLKIKFLIWTDLEPLNQKKFETKVEETIKI